MSDSVTPWTAACQAPLSSTVSWSLLKFMSIESVMPSNHLILCHPLLLLPSIFPSIRIFSSESVLHIRWPKYWSFSLESILPMHIQDWFPLGLTGLISLQRNITNHKKKNEIMPFEATWEDLEIIMLSEVRQTEKTNIWYHLYWESKKKMLNKLI